MAARTTSRSLRDMCPKALLEQRTGLDQQSLRLNAFLAHLLIDQFVVQDQVRAPVAVRINPGSRAFLPIGIFLGRSSLPHS